MLTLVRSIVSVVACRVRSRVDLELEVLALRHQPYTRPGGGDSNSKPWSDVRRNQIPRVSRAGSAEGDRVGWRSLESKLDFFAVIFGEFASYGFVRQHRETFQFQVGMLGGHRGVD